MSYFDHIKTIINLAANTTLDPGAHAGAFITNTGATGAVTITLPTGTAAMAGWWCQVFVTTAQNVTVATQTTDTLMLDGDATADSIGWVTGSHQIGNGATFVCLGTAGYACLLNPAATTTTIATQTLAT
jgi:hypothetical protein